MKKILILHTQYQVQGGEDIAVENEVNFLSESYDIERVTFSNKIENYFSQTISFVRNNNSESIETLNNRLDSFKPDTVYIHNTWFKASLGIFNLLKDKQIKPLLKLHNFRYDCTKSHRLSVHLNNNNPCKACGLTAKSSNLYNKYYEDSYSKSFFINKYGKKYFKILNNYDLNLIVLTNFHKQYIKEVNLIDQKISVIPNVIDITDVKKEKNKKRYMIYAGRISKEKGVEELITSFINCNFSDVNLKIVGSGPLLEYLKNTYKNEKIQFMNSLPNNEVLRLINNSIAVVTATKLHEGQPTLLCEASAMGIPSIFPKSGGISEFFPKDYLFSFNQFDYKDLEKKLNLVINSNNLEKIGTENKKYINKYLNKKSLLSKFEELINE